jgi:hypothetical protein
MKELLEILYDDLKDLLTLGKMVKREKKLEVLTIMCYSFLKESCRP